MSSSSHCIQKLEKVWVDVLVTMAGLPNWQVLAKGAIQGSDTGVLPTGAQFDVTDPHDVQPSVCIFGMISSNQTVLQTMNWLVTRKN